MTPEKIARCLICNEEFTGKELKDFDRCPKCGNTGIPCSPKEDVIIKINWHELRILVIWAENWANKIDKDCATKPAVTIVCIARRVQNQYPDKTPLTLTGEIQQLRNDKTLSNIETNIPENPNKIAGEFNA